MNKSNATKKGAAIASAMLITGVSIGTLFAQQNLIVNGSFESGGKATFQQFPGWDQIGPADNNSDYGIAESTVSPDVAEQGNFYAYFHGHPTDSSQDCLGQTVNLIVGARYTITYYLATDGSTLGTGAAMWVVIGTSFGIDPNQDAYLTSYYPNSSTALSYQEFTTNYVALESSEILSFHGINATNGVDAPSSILLDNVSMVLDYPQLSVSLSVTNTLIFSWNSLASGFRLQTNTSLGTVGWTTLTNTPSTMGSHNQIVLPMSASNVYYRLTLP